MIDLEKFEEIRKRCGDFASWAVWAESGERPKSNVGDLSALNPEENSQLLGTLHGNTVFLGLNISRPIDRPFGNFHDPRSMAMDFKIRYALQGTPYWGSYMTDIIKFFEEKSSKNLIEYLRTNREFEKENVNSLRSELELLEASGATLVTFGRDAEKIAKRNLGEDFDIIYIPHYANFISKENYRSQVLDALSNA